METYLKRLNFNKNLNPLRVQLWLLLSIMFLAGSCSDGMFNDDDINNDITLLSQSLSSNFGKIGISDAANGGNVDEFYFLAPTTGKEPKFHGKFNPNLSPVVEISDDFESVISEISNYFSQNKFESACRELSNGWWVYVNLSSDSVKRICATLIESAGIPEDEYELEVW